MRIIKFSFYFLSFIAASIVALSQHNDYYYGVPPSLMASTNMEGAFCGVSIPSDNIQEKKIKMGKILFKSKCATCHNKNMKSDMTGPALAGVEQRWSDYPKTDLYKWIRNSQEMIHEGHPKASEIWSQWQPTIMINFLELKDEDIEAILAYVEYTYHYKH